MIALAHVETPRAGHEFDVAEIGRALRGDLAPAVGCLLQRHAVLVALGDVEERAPIRPQQPLVGREHEKVGIERPHVERDDAHGVRRIDQQRCSLRAQSRGDALDVHDPAIGPVHGRYGREGDWRRTGPRDRGEHRRGPIAVIGLPHDVDA